MSRLLLLPLAGIAAAAQAAPAKKAPASEQKPNILWVMAEDMGHDLACYGMAAVRTPVLDKMAAGGVQYMNGCCTNPISSPSRSAMITGVHQCSTGCHNHRTANKKPLPDGIVPITHLLRQQGYTCILGHSKVMDKGRKTDFNFKFTPLGEWNGEDKLGVFDKYDNIYASDQPFFAQVQLKVTHRGDWWTKVRSESKHPVDPAKVVLPGFLPDHPKVREEWACYLDMVERMDDEMGILLDDLKRKGLLDNTIIFFVGDNGRCEVRGKGYLYESGTKIPMIAWGKGIQQARVDEIVSTLDISATILKLAGAEMPGYLQGAPLFDEQGRSAKGRGWMFAARDDLGGSIECIRSISTPQYTYIRNYRPDLPWDQFNSYFFFNRPALHIMHMLLDEGKLTPGQALFFAPTKPKEELYDIIKDPNEFHNLATDPAYAKVLADLRLKMDSWQKQYGDTGLADLPKRKQFSGQAKMPEWVKENHPDEYKKILEGNIVDKFTEWTAEEAAQRKAKNN